MEQVETTIWILHMATTKLESQWCVLVLLCLLWGEPQASHSRLHLGRRFAKMLWAKGWQSAHAPRGPQIMRIKLLITIPGQGLYFGLFRCIRFGLRLVAYVLLYTSLYCSNCFILLFLALDLFWEANYWYPYLVKASISDYLKMVFMRY